MSRCLHNQSAAASRDGADRRNWTGLLTKPIEKAGWTPLPHSDEDLERAKSVPDTPQTRASTFRLAWNDEEFMTRRELRPVRLQLELLKPEMILAERGIRSTVVLFGGARLPEPGGEAWAAKGATVGYLPQEPVLDPALNVRGTRQSASVQNVSTAVKAGAIVVNWVDNSVDEALAVGDEGSAGATGRGRTRK